MDKKSNCIRGVYSITEILYRTLGPRGVFSLVSCVRPPTPEKTRNKRKKVIKYGFVLKYFAKNSYLYVNFLI